MSVVKRTMTISKEVCAEAAICDVCGAEGPPTPEGIGVAFKNEWGFVGEVGSHRVDDLCANCLASIKKHVASMKKAAQ